MSGYNQFQVATLGMRSQAHALNTIGINVANVKTNGFKRTDTEFETLLSRSLGPQSDLGGIKPTDFQRIDQQGFINSSTRNLDIAINGDGFFYVSPTFNVSNEVFFTRDGSFQIGIADGQTSDITADDGDTITVSNGYLVDSNGHFVLGASPDANGIFSAAGALAPMRIDESAFVGQSTQSSTARLQLNLDSNKTPGFDATTADQFNIELVDSAGEMRSVQLNFYRSFTDNAWQIVPIADDATSLSLTGSAFSETAARVAYTSNTIQAKSASDIAVAGAFAGLKTGDPITVGGSTSNDGTYTISSISADGSTVTLSTSTLTGGSETLATALTSSQVVASPMAFNGNGTIQTPTSSTLDVTWSDGSTNSVVIDTSTMQQYAGGFTPFLYEHNGLASASMTSIKFDQSGHIIGSFGDATERIIYKLPLAQFQNPDGLQAHNGQIFSETTNSGTASFVFADESGRAQLSPFSIEVSNVDITREFSRMIQVQNAYNHSATVFRTVDEMVTVARDLKA